MNQDIHQDSYIPFDYKGISCLAKYCFYYNFLWKDPWSPYGFLKNYQQICEYLKPSICSYNRGPDVCRMLIDTIGQNISRFLPSSPLRNTEIFYECWYILEKEQFLHLIVDISLCFRPALVFKWMITSLLDWHLSVTND